MPFVNSLPLETAPPSTIDGIVDALGIDLRVPQFATRAEATAGSVPAATQRIMVNGHTAEGDAPPALFRRATVAEEALPGVITTADTAKWIFADNELVPEWFGAVADASGMTGVGTDNTAALQNLLTVASALKVKAVIPTGRKYRCASSSYSPSGRRVVLMYDSDLDLEVRGEIVHDAQTVDEGGPTILWPNTANNPAPENRKKRVHIAFIGAGCISYPNDAVFAGSSRKAGITIAWTDEFSVTRVATKGTTATGFQLTLSSSTYGLIDGGMVGVPDAPVSNGDDGLHFIGGCQNIIARGGISRSGDDCLSFTQEGGDGTGTTERDNHIMENILVTDWLCDTERASSIKFDIVGTVRNCAIRNVTLSNISGTARGTVRGAGIAMKVDHVDGSGNKIEKIRFNDVDLSPGPLPKSEPNDGIALGNLVRLLNVDDVRINGAMLRGASNSLVSMRHCRGCVVEGDFYPSGESAALLTGVGVVSVVTQGNGNRRIALSGSPDLSAVVAQLSAFTAGAQEYDYKKPIVSLTGMTGAGYNNGSFVILAADNTAKWIEIENLRASQSDETPAAATATIWISKVPDVLILDSEECHVEGTIHGPLGWTAAWVSTRSGRKASSDTAAVSTDVSRRNTVVLKVLGQSFGHAIRSDKARDGRYSVVARGCRSGSPMLVQGLDGSVTESWNHWLDSDDFGGMQSPTNSGYGRGLVTAYASDRMDRIRGVTGSTRTGTATQASGATSFTVSASAGFFAGVPLSSINPAWLRVSTRGTPVAYSVTWDSGTALFTVTTATAAGAATTWDYVVEPPF